VCQAARHTGHYRERRNRPRERAGLRGGVHLRRRPGVVAPSEAVRYDQKGCQYIPHVAVMQANQPLEIYNDDQTSHNIHPLAKVNPEWNKSQPIGAPPIHTTWEKPEFIPVKCNVHPWMHGWFLVLTTSHYAVTGEDGGFSLKGLPPGKYTLTAWQEQFGTQTQDVTISGTETKTVDFVFKGSGLLRIDMGKLFAVVVVLITLVSAAIFASHIWWLPVDISAHGQAIDRQLTETMATSGELFCALELALAVFAWRYGDRKDGRKVTGVPWRRHTHGGAGGRAGRCRDPGPHLRRLQSVGRYLPGAPDPNSLQIVRGLRPSKFAFYFATPGRDGRFGSVHPERIDEASGNFFGLDPATSTTARDDIVVPTLGIPGQTGRPAHPARQGRQSRVLRTRAAHPQDFVPAS